MPRGSKRVRKGTVRIVFHKPVAVSGHSAETLPALMERVRASIASGV